MGLKDGSIRHGLKDGSIRHGVEGDGSIRHGVEGDGMAFRYTILLAQDFRECCSTVVETLL